MVIWDVSETPGPYPRYDQCRFTPHIVENAYERNIENAVYMASAEMCKGTVYRSAIFFSLIAGHFQIGSFLI